MWPAEVPIKACRGRFICRGIWHRWSNRRVVFVAAEGIPNVGSAQVVLVVSVVHALIIISCDAVLVVVGSKVFFTQQVGVRRSVGNLAELDFAALENNSGHAL